MRSVFRGLEPEFLWESINVRSMYELAMTADPKIGRNNPEVTINGIRFAYNGFRRGPKIFFYHPALPVMSMFPTETLGRGKIAKKLPNYNLDDALKSVRHRVTCGIVKPVWVQPRGRGYAIIDGHHRFAVALECNQKTLPAWVGVVERPEWKGRSPEAKWGPFWA